MAKENNLEGKSTKDIIKLILPQNKFQWWALINVIIGLVLSGLIGATIGLLFGSLINKFGKVEHKETSNKKKITLSIVYTIATILSSFVVVMILASFITIA